MFGFGPLGTAPAGTGATVAAPAAPDPALPVMGGSIALSAITTSGAHAAWQAATDSDGTITGYEVSCDLGVAVWANIGNVLSVDLSLLQSATQYTVRVRAVDNDGVRSNVLTAPLLTNTPVQLPPGTDLLLSVAMYSFPRDRMQAVHLSA